MKLLVCFYSDSLSSVYWYYSLSLHLMMVFVFFPLLVDMKLHPFRMKFVLVKFVYKDYNDY